MMDADDYISIGFILFCVLAAASILVALSWGFYDYVVNHPIL